MEARKASCDVCKQSDPEPIVPCADCDRRFHWECIPDRLLNGDSVVCESCLISLYDRIDRIQVVINQREKVLQQLMSDMKIFNLEPGKPTAAARAHGESSKVHVNHANDKADVINDSVIRTRAIDADVNIERSSAVDSWLCPIHTDAEATQRPSSSDDAAIEVHVDQIGGMRITYDDLLYPPRVSALNVNLPLQPMAQREVSDQMRHRHCEAILQLPLDFRVNKDGEEFVSLSDAPLLSTESPIVPIVAEIDSSKVDSSGTELNEEHEMALRVSIERVLNSDEDIVDVLAGNGSDPRNLVAGPCVFSQLVVLKTNFPSQSMACREDEGSRYTVKRFEDPDIDRTIGDELKANKLEESCPNFDPLPAESPNVLYVVKTGSPVVDSSDTEIKEEHGHVDILWKKRKKDYANQPSRASREFFNFPQMFANFDPVKQENTEQSLLEIIDSDYDPSEEVSDAGSFGETAIEVEETLNSANDSSGELLADFSWMHPDLHPPEPLVGWVIGDKSPRYIPAVMETPKKQVSQSESTSKRSLVTYYDLLSFRLSRDLYCEPSPSTQSAVHGPDCLQEEEELMDEPMYPQEKQKLIEFDRLQEKQELALGSVCVQEELELVIRQMYPQEEEEKLIVWPNRVHEKEGVVFKRKYNKDEAKLDHLSVRVQEEELIGGPYLLQEKEELIPVPSYLHEEEELLVEHDRLKEEELVDGLKYAYAKLELIVNSVCPQEEEKLVIRQKVSSCKEELSGGQKRLSVEVEESEVATSVSALNQDVNMESQPSTSGGGGSTASASTTTSRPVLTRLRWDSECEDYPDLAVPAPRHWRSARQSDLRENQEMYWSEFQAIVLAAGSGSRLTEIRGERAKCLLNVGPFPMIWYPLNLLQNHGFREATVVVLESETDLKIKLDFATIPSDKDFGMAESLKHIYDRIKRDVLVIYCDVITNANLNPFMNTFREHNASFVSLLLPGGQAKGAVVPGPKTKYKPERDLIGVHPETNRFLFFAALSDCEERRELEKKITESSLFNDTQAKKPYNADVIRCYAHISPKDTFGLRVNTLTSVWAADQKVLGEWEKIVGDHHPLVSASATMNCTQMVSSGVAHGATVAEKTSLKNTIIGPQSVVNVKTRISDSVLIAGVTVEEGCVIENCMICDGAEIKKGAVFKSSSWIAGRMNR